jgi:VIT1/CCC1 family predicted Fe2+/Mn2+ transporter
VSVSSQADTERADLALERRELSAQPQAEEDELAGIYVRRGLQPDLARTVAQQLMARDALAAHARDELGLAEELAARPCRFAFASVAESRDASTLRPLCLTAVRRSICGWC